MKQRTIKNQVSISGIGIHSGVHTNVKLLPSKENSGIMFVRTDLKENNIIHAHINNLHSTKRSTDLKYKNAQVRTVEHLLAAISGFQIDNIIIEIDNIEIPILDGSAKIFTQIIEQAGIQELEEEKDYYEIKRKISLFDESTGTKIIAFPSNKFEINVDIDYNSKVLGKQNATLNNISDFQNKISSSRTFCFLHELETLIDNNLIKGGNINNAIVIVEEEINDDKLNKLRTIFNKKDIRVSKSGILNNLSLRFKNEPARHKLLDVIGDLTLLGKPIKGKIVAYKPGHKNNTKFAKYLNEIMTKDLKNSAPKLDFNKPPLYNKEKIKTILPHRDPFLFIDEIRDIGEDFIIGVKHVKSEEEYFKGHFPSEPVMPGVLQLETMAQAGGVLILNTVKNPEDYLTFFMKIDNAKFKQKVIPGDTLIFHLQLISPIRRGLCHMHGKGFVNNKIVVEADLLAQISPKNK
ncbi:MAG: UDP-3-O-[3-hydroxymyristoyl] N-acetylglucosamine deacetylase [Flavobacteriales bacterium]|nr:UDP-3-O-[3-hydroxymyristoyl] N-acetylglucosamine deacetylase [Flavobacteriales bacterium]